MKNVERMNGLTRYLNKTGLTLKKYSPEILVVGGVIGLVSSAVMACKATTKVDTIIEKSKTRIDGIHATLEDPDMRQEYFDEFKEEYTVEQSKKDLAIVYTQTGLDFAKLYGPAVVLGALSISAIFASNNIMRKRNVALAAAYTVVDKGFKEYRGRVIERFGKDLDRELRYNIKTKEVETVVTNEDGTESVVKETVNVVDPNTRGDYTKCFDETCLGWTRDAEYNLMFLKQQQNYFNDKLKTEGVVFLNDIYKALGFQVTRAGQVVGWVYDEKNPVGDNFIDFGIYDLHDEQKRAFVNGYEKSIWLDFNPDGPILDLLQ